jgi:hypothetical protein
VVLFAPQEAPNYCWLKMSFTPLEFPLPEKVKVSISVITMNSQQKCESKVPQLFLFIGSLSYAGQIIRENHSSEKI